LINDDANHLGIIPVMQLQVITPCYGTYLSTQEITVGLSFYM